MELRSVMLNAEVHAVCWDKYKSISIERQTKMHQGNLEFARKDHEQ